MTSKSDDKCKEFNVFLWMLVLISLKISTFVEVKVQLIIILLGISFGLNNLGYWYFASPVQEEISVCSKDEGSCCDDDETEPCCSEKGCCEKVPGTSLTLNFIAGYLNKSFRVQFFHSESKCQYLNTQQSTSSGFLNSLLRPPIA